MSMFEKASRMKLRFNTPVGRVSVEDLWEMPLENPKGADLDKLAISLNKAIKDNNETSFVKKKSLSNTVLDLKFDIVKYIITVKIEEAEARVNAAASKTQLDKLDRLIEQKENEALLNTDISDLKKQRDKLKESAKLD